MLSFQLMTEKDRREAARIERRRIQEEERKKRIFNPRSRKIGIDTVALKTQIEEKKKREEEEKRVDQIFENHLNQSDQIAVSLIEKQKKEEKKLLKEINEFRKYYQKPEDRREFDLNDPQLLKKQLPARLHDDDPRMGPSCAQKFEGEDLISEQRLKVQREQIKAWLDQQLLEKELAEQERKMAEEAYKAAVIARDARALELDHIEKRCRQKLEEATIRYNLALAQEKCQEKMSEKQQTLQDNTAEIYNNLTSDMLTENPATCQSNMGPGRKIACMYKGMSEKQKQQIRNEQLTQIAETKKQKELELRTQKEYEDYLNGINKSVYLMDREQERAQKERLKKLAEENKRLAEEQKSQKNYLDKIVYSNRATPEYFDQFNKSSR